MSAARFAEVDLPAACTGELVLLLDRLHGWFGAAGGDVVARFDGGAEGAVWDVGGELVRAARRVGWEIR